VEILDYSDIGFSKKFTPNTIEPNGVSTLSFTLTNPFTTPLTGVQFSDTLPTTPGNMVVAPAESLVGTVQVTGGSPAIVEAVHIPNPIKQRMQLYQFCEIHSPVNYRQYPPNTIHKLWRSRCEWFCDDCSTFNHNRMRLADLFPRGQATHLFPLLAAPCCRMVLAPSM